jgi:tetratricopeptide (TPR) repeat protein
MSDAATERPERTAMPDERGRHAERRAEAVRGGVPSRPVGAVLSLTAAAALALGGPFGLSRLAELPGNAAARLLYAGERPTDAGYVRLIDSREAALRWAERAAPHRDLGHFYLALVDELGDTEERRRELLARAEAELVAALSRSPADPGALAVLASTYMALERDQDARLWLERAQRIAPYSPETALVRAWVALVTKPEDTPLAPSDIRDLKAAFIHDRDRFVQMVVEIGAAERVLAAFPQGEERYEFGVALMRANEEGRLQPTDPPLR